MLVVTASMPCGWMFEAACHESPDGHDSGTRVERPAKPVTTLSCCQASDRPGRSLWLQNAPAGPLKSTPPTPVTILRPDTLVKRVTERHVLPSSYPLYLLDSSYRI